MYTTTTARPLQTISAFVAVVSAVLVTRANLCCDEAHGGECVSAARSRMSRIGPAGPLA